MSIGHRSYDDAKATNPADRELGNVGDRGMPPRGTCITCGAKCDRWMCEDCYRLGRTCGLRGEMEE